MCGCLSSSSYWGLGLQPRHVPWLGIEPMTLWFEGGLSIHWDTPARAKNIHFKMNPRLQICDSQCVLIAPQGSFIPQPLPCPPPHLCSFSFPDWPTSKLGIIHWEWGTDLLLVHTCFEGLFQLSTSLTAIRITRWSIFKKHSWSAPSPDLLNLSLSDESRVQAWVFF